MAEAIPALTLRSIRAVPIEVPMTYVLGTSAAAIKTASLLLIDLETEQGITGRGYLFCYMREAAAAMAAMVDAAGSAFKGDRVAPLDLWAKLARRFKLIGVQGIVRMAMAGIDVAAWDALAIAAGVPLATLLGSAPRPIRAYNSCGLGLMSSPDAVADEAEKLLSGGFTGVKLRLGYPTLAADLAAVRAVRRRIPDSAALMVDYNQALGVAEALKRGRALDDEGIYWLEEPIAHDDYAGYARLVAKLKTPIQIGENFSEVTSMAMALSQRAAVFVMPDLERIGGVTGWQLASGLAAAHRIEMSSHLFPEVSAHLLAATPTGHWLEYMDWANAILEEPLRIEDGFAIPSARPGNGLVWREDAVAHYRMT